MVCYWYLKLLLISLICVLGHLFYLAELLQCPVLNQCFLSSWYHSMLSHCLLVCGSPISYLYLSPFLVVLGNVFLFPYLYIPGFHLILEDVVQVTFLYDLMSMVPQAFQFISYDFYFVLVPT